MRMFSAYLVPKKGFQVLDPGNKNRALPEGGAKVRGNVSYWTRQIEAGDVQISEPVAPAVKVSTSDKGNK